MGWETLIRDIAGLLRALEESGDRGISFRRDGKLPAVGRNEREAHYDLSVHVNTLAGGQPGTPTRDNRADEPPPDFDLFDEPDAVVVVVQSPGACAEDIRVEAVDGGLTIRVGTGRAASSRRAQLPAGTQLGPPQWSVNNGVLVIRLPKVTPDQNDPEGGATV